MAPSLFRRAKGFPFVALSALLVSSGLAAPVAAAPRAPAPPPEVAITVDDVPVHGPLPAGTTRLQVASDMLAALRAAGVGSVTGFVNGGAIAGDPASEAVLPAWRAAGYPLGNHTWTHANLNALSDADYEAEIARGEPMLERLAEGSDWRWFRYPFLAEGDDPARRATIRHFLADRHYKIAAVTMDFADYDWNPPYARCTAKGDEAAIARLEQSYLDAALEGMNGARTLSHALYGRDIPYVLLMHIGAFDARMMPRLLALFRARGFRFVPLAEAERDPVYAQDVDPSQPAGPSGLVARARARGLALPPLYTQVAALDSICR